MATNLTNNQVPNEISLKELLLKIGGLITYLKSKGKIILLFCLVGCIIGTVYAFVKKPKYIASLTFALEEEKSGGGGGIAGALGIASSLGIDIGGANAGGAFSGSNLIELMQSRRVIEKALLNPITVNGETKSLAGYFIEFTHLNKGWEQIPKLKDIRFDTFANRSTFTLQHDSILGIIYRKMVDQNGLLSVSQKDKKISIITIEVSTHDELFSKTFAESIAKVVSDFYVETKSKKARMNYEILEKQADSVRNELNKAIMGVAIANDNTYNLNPALNVNRTPSARRQVDIQANTAILTQLVANLEMSKVSLRKETPLIQIIDKPILPLKKEEVFWLKSLLIGGALGGLIIILTLLLRRGWQKVMSE